MSWTVRSIFAALPFPRQPKFPHVIDPKSQENHPLNYLFHHRKRKKKVIHTKPNTKPPYPRFILPQNASNTSSQS